MRTESSTMEESLTAGSVVFMALHMIQFLVSTKKRSVKTLTDSSEFLHFYVLQRFSSHDKY